MPRKSKIYTGCGDNGSTGLCRGQRVPKTSIRIEAYGTVDELNAQLGVVLASRPAPELATVALQIQDELFQLGAQLCNPDHADENADSLGIGNEQVVALETALDKLDEQLEPLKNFILPGGHPAAAQLHVARTVCRRAERATVKLGEVEPVGKYAISYLNRLSDLLFVMARYQNFSEGIAEQVWKRRG